MVAQKNVPGVFSHQYQQQLFLLCEAVLPYCLFYLKKKKKDTVGKHLYLGTWQQVF